MPDAQELIDLLGLEPHPEGGRYRQVYRSSSEVGTPRGPRSAMTTIHFLLRAGEQSRWHAVAADEVWHFYAGDPLELWTYDPGARRLARHVLAPPGGGDGPVAVVRAGQWQAARPLGAFALAGCTVAPGFEFRDFSFVADLEGHEAHFTDEMGTLSDLL